MVEFKWLNLNGCHPSLVEFKTLNSLLNDCSPLSVVYLLIHLILVTLFVYLRLFMLLSSGRAYFAKDYSNLNGAFMAKQRFYKTNNTF